MNPNPKISLLKCTLAGALLAPSLATAAPSALVAYWNFNDSSNPEQAADAVAGRVGSFSTGTAYSADQGGFSGAAGDRAVDFGTTGGTHVLVGDGSFLRLAGYGDQLTVTFWQKLYSVTDASSFWALSPSSGGDQRGAQAHVPWSNQNIYFDTSGCCDTDLTRINQSILDYYPEFDWTQWHHFAFVKDGSIKRIYVDGELFLEGSGDPLPTDFTSLIIGGAPNGANPVRGLMDDFAVFVAPLTDDQIASLANKSETPTGINVTLADADNDGLPDIYETAHGLNPNANDAEADPDNDGLTNMQEYAKGTHPMMADTDGDGLSDGVETNTGVYVSATDTGTDPLNRDTDGDGLRDGAETKTGIYVSYDDAGTDPFDPDGDKDGFSDGVEAILKSNPLDANVTPIKPGSNLLAFWDFNTTSNSESSADVVNGIISHFENGATYATGAGRTGAGNDNALDLPSGATPPAAGRVTDGFFLNAASSRDTLSVSLWAQLYEIHNGAFFFAVSPSSSGGARGYAAFPWGNETIYFDTAGCCSAATQRIEVPISSFPDYTDFSFWLEWHHYVFVKNGSRKEIWVDGKLLHSGNNTSPLPFDFTEFLMGFDQPDNTSIYGLLDDIAIFGSALNEYQIAALAGGTSPTQLDGDTDGDGMPDIWEDAHGLAKNDPADASQDPDGDGLTNLQEFQRGTLPKTADTDGDGLNDGVETGTGIWVSATDTGTSPLLPDTDGDGIPDNVENNTGTFVSATNPGTNPNLADTDGDGFSDGLEIQLGSDPTSAASAPAQVGALNLLAYWDFNDASNPEITTDKVHGYVGELAVDAGTIFTEDQLGRSGAAGDRAIDFGYDTAGQLVHVEDAAWLNIASMDDRMTVVFWQQLYDVASTSAFWLGSPSSSDNERGFQAHVPWGDGTIYFDTAGCCDAPRRINRNIADLDPDFDWTQWHHFAFVKDKENKRIFVDGQLFHEGSGAAPLPADFNRFNIGADIAGNSSMHGLLDDFAIFASALTPEEIQQLANGAKPNELPPRTVATTPTLTLSVGDGGSITITTSGARLQQADSVTGPYTDLESNTVTVTPATAGDTKFYRGRN